LNLLLRTSATDSDDLFSSRTAPRVPMMSDAFFEQELSSIKARGLFREPRIHSPADNEHGLALNFSSNDYLGLSTDERVRLASVRAIEQCGTGATASRLMAGNSELAEGLEADIASMMGTEASLVFGSGFLTNLGVLSSLAGEGDEVFSDELNHASIIDGIRLSHARRSIYKHKDLGTLESLLKSSTARKKVIVSESVFSMDGDVAPVSALRGLADRYGALFVIDEAHAVGVMGRKGGGVCRIDENKTRPDIVVGTLSKALGGYGGFAACSRAARSFFANRARSFIYSTGLPPACLGAAREAVAIVTSPPDMGIRLLEKAHRFHDALAEYGLGVLPFESHIVPVVAGSNEKTVSFSQLLNRRGILVHPIRPPTVPPGTGRIRFSITLKMSDEALEKAAATTAQAAAEAGLIS
jgi:8-amino-7-oxononanoate synthase